VIFQTPNRVSSVVWRGVLAFVGALGCAAGSADAQDALASLTVPAVAREEAPRASRAWDEPSTRDLYDFGDLSGFVGERAPLDRAYQDALDRAVADSRLSELSATLADDNIGWTQKREIKLRTRDDQSR
jgi:hypothetical protein